MNSQDKLRFQKHINIAQSFLNWAGNGHSGDKILMEKLLNLHMDEINGTVLRLLNVKPDDLRAEAAKCFEWIQFLDDLIIKGEELEEKGRAANKID